MTSKITAANETNPIAIGHQTFRFNFFHKDWGDDWGVSSTLIEYMKMKIKLRIFLKKMNFTY